MSKLKLKHFGIAKRQVHQIIQIHNRNLSEKNLFQNKLQKDFVPNDKFLEYYSITLYDVTLSLYVS